LLKVEIIVAQRGSIFEAPSIIVAQRGSIFEAPSIIVAQRGSIFEAPSISAIKLFAVNHPFFSMPSALSHFFTLGLKFIKLC